MPQEEIDKQDKSLQKNFRRRVAPATPNRLIRDFGTPEQEEKTERWSQPISEREAPQPPPDLLPWQSILPPLGKTSDTLPEKKVARFQ